MWQMCIAMSAPSPHFSRIGDVQRARTSLHVGSLAMPSSRHRTSLRTCQPPIAAKSLHEMHQSHEQCTPASQRQQPNACTICTKATSNARLPASDSSQKPARYAPKPRAMHACLPATVAKSLHDMHQSHEQCTPACQRQQPKACTKRAKATSDARMPASENSQKPARNAPKALAMRACQSATAAKSQHEMHQRHEQCAPASHRQQPKACTKRTKATSDAHMPTNDKRKRACRRACLLPAPSPLSVCP